MRVLYLNSELNRIDSEPGTWARLVVQELRNTGAEVETFPPESSSLANNEQSISELSSPADGFKAVLKRQLPRNWALLLVEFYMFFRGFGRSISIAVRLWRRRSEMADIDIVLARVYEYEWTPWLTARALKKPFVLEVHAPFYLERRFRGRGHSRLLHWFEQVQWHRANGIWVNSREMIRLMLENGVAEESIERIPHAVDLQRFCPGVADEQVHADAVEIVFVGSFYPWHGVKLLIEAFDLARREVPNLKLCLIGDGIERSSIERLVRNLELGEAVEFTGWLEYEQLIARLCESDIGVAPFLKLEPFYFDPVKIVEYMGAGLAIVASNLGGITEMLEDGRLGSLVAPGDVQGLKCAIVKLALDPESRARMGGNSRAKLEEEQTWEIASRRIIALCNKAIACNA